MGGGELSMGGGMSGDDKAFGIGFRKQFSNGSLSEEYYGKSQLAYQKAVEDGFQGTYEEYLRFISPTKSFADGGRAAFGDGSVTAVKKVEKRVIGKDPRLVKLFNKKKFYHLRLR